MSRSINWNYPSPGKGLQGIWDRFAGPGTTIAENSLTLLSATTASVALIYYQYLEELNWTLIQQLIGVFISFDVVGGVVANTTSSAKRWYHRNGQSGIQHFTFVIVHILQILLVAWGFTDMDWHFVSMTYAALLISAALVLAAPPRIQRSLALLLASGSVAFQHYAVPSIPGFEWFIPVLFIKLLAGHLVHEEPYE